MEVVMNMSSYEIEHDDAMKAEYAEEMLSSGWNPAVALACQQHALPKNDRKMEISSSLAAVDVEKFLQKMYACQR